MTWLLSDSEFEQASAALDRGEITRQLHAFLGRLVHVVAATRTLPPSLSTTGRWDPEGVEETVAGWWEERLLTGTLRSAFDRCASPRALSRYLETSLRNWLIDRTARIRDPGLLRRRRGTRLRHLVVGIEHLGGRAALQALGCLVED
jgi:hypothetical protein